MKIFITEKQEKQIIGMLFKESATYSVEPEKVLIVKKYLDRTFSKADYTNVVGGEVQNNMIALYKNPKTGEPIEDNPITPGQVFENIEAEFKNIYSDRIRRTKFLQLVVKDWFNNRISPFGLLSTNAY